jgi:hypothetical protein
MGLTGTLEGPPNNNLNMFRVFFIIFITNLDAGGIMDGS